MVKHKNNAITHLGNHNSCAGVIQDRMLGVSVIGRIISAPVANENRHRAGEPSKAQRAYLLRGLRQPGGKLPLFDRNGQRVRTKTVQACLDAGWAEHWFHNPIKPDWQVCRLTSHGYQILGVDQPARKSA
jgi:hypothetical protein